MKKILMMGALAILFFANIQRVFAGDSVVVADVDVTNIIIIEQDAENKIVFEFEVVNNSNHVEPLVKYAIILNKNVGSSEDGSDQSIVIVDEQYVDEVDTLNPGEVLRKQFTYTPPSVLSGEFMLGVKSSNERGMPLALNVGKNIKLHEIQKKGVKIFGDTCFLNIDNDKINFFSLSQGVDISKEEKLFVTCDVFNYSEKTENTTPLVITHRRMSMGSILSTKAGPKVFLEKGANKITFLVPTEKVPQAYSAIITIGNEDNSNAIDVHYVVQGESATVQSAQLDKTKYNKGDIANVDLIFSGRTDLFLNARGLEDKQYKPQVFLYDIVIKNKKGNICGQGTGEYSEDQLTVKSKVKIIRACDVPSVFVELKNKAGIKMDTMQYTVQTKEKSSEKIYRNSPIEWKKIISAIIVLMPFVAIIIFLIVKRMKGGMNILLFLCVAVSLFMLTDQVFAKTLRVHSPWSRILGNISQSYVTFTPSQTTFCEGEMMIAVQATSVACANGEVGVTGYIKDEGAMSVSEFTKPNEVVGVYSRGATRTTSGIVNHRVNPFNNSVGTHTVGIGAKSWTYYSHLSTMTLAKACRRGGGTVAPGSIGSSNKGTCIWDTAIDTLTYTIKRCVDGECGPLYLTPSCREVGSTATFEGAGGKCAQGNVIEVRGSGTFSSPWTWNCSGDGGVQSENCCMYKKALIINPKCSSSISGEISNNIASYPSSQLCDEGNPSRKTGEGTVASPWKWTCGNESGISGQCSAWMPANGCPTDASEGTTGVYGSGYIFDYFDSQWSDWGNRKFCKAGDIVNPSSPIFPVPAGETRWGCNDSDKNCIAYRYPKNVSCPFLNNSKYSYKEGDIIVEFNTPVIPREKRAVLLADREHRKDGSVAWFVESDTVVPSGTYNVWLSAYDAYTKRVDTSKQLNEQFFVKLLNSNQEKITKTGSTGDLVDNTLTAWWNGPNGYVNGVNGGTTETNFSVNESASTVVAVHPEYYTKNKPNSVVPICVWFEKVTESEAPSPPSSICLVNTDWEDWKITNNVDCRDKSSCGKISKEEQEKTTTSADCIEIKSINRKETYCGDCPKISDWIEVN